MSEVCSGEQTFARLRTGFRAVKLLPNQKRDRTTERKAKRLWPGTHTVHSATCGKRHDPDRSIILFNRYGVNLSHGCYSTAVRAVSTHTVVIHNTDRQYPDNCDSEHGCYSTAVRIVSTHTVVIHSTGVTLQV